MNDQFELFQDENAHRSLSVRGPSVQPNVLPTTGTQDGFGPSKTVLSSRKALGNITNNSGSFSVSHKQALGNPSHNNKNVEQQHRNRRVDGKPSFSKTLAGREAADIDKRLDDLVKGGIERSAGPTWEEQQALKELELESAFPWSIVDNHEQITRSRMSNICKEIVHENEVEAKRLVDIREAIKGNGRISSPPESLESPSSPEQRMSIFDEWDDLSDKDGFDLP